MGFQGFLKITETVIYNLAYPINEIYCFQSLKHFCYEMKVTSELIKKMTKKNMVSNWLFHGMKQSSKQNFITIPICIVVETLEGISSWDSFKQTNLPSVQTVIVTFTQTALPRPFFFFKLCVQTNPYFKTSMLNSQLPLKRKRVITQLLTISFGRGHLLFRVGK